MERQLISSGAAFEERVGYSRAVRVGDHVWVSGTAPIMPGDADPPDGAYEQAKVCLGIIERALAEAGASLDDVVRTRIYVTDATHIDEVGRAHGEAFGRARPATTGDRHRAPRSALARGDRGGSGDTPVVKQIFPPSITGKGAVGTGGAQASVLDHAFGKGDPYTLGVEEEYMLLDPETWDLVQHIDSVLAAVEHGEHEDRIHAELMQSVLEVTTPVCRTAGDVHARARAAARLRRRDRPRRGLPVRLGGHAPVQPLRAAADHRARPLPAARRPAAVHRTARADLRHAHARRGRRSRRRRSR